MKWKGKKERKATKYLVVLLIIRTRAVQVAMKILNLIGAKKKVKVLMKEVKQNKRKSKRKRRV
jgi:hypothetical protein